MSIAAVPRSEGHAEGELPSTDGPHGLHIPSPYLQQFPSLLQLNEASCGAATHALSLNAGHGCGNPRLL
jgi:hypothetical protein